MTDATIQNPFAPPRALVKDKFDAPNEMILASRLSRLAAVSRDGDRQPAQEDEAQATSDSATLAGSSAHRMARF